MSTINALYYSNVCQPSQHLISLMQNEQLIRYFHLICTDNNPNVPVHVKTTPTILIRGIAAPYSGTDAFVWLSKVKQWKTNIMLRNINNQQQQYLQNINGNLTSTNDSLLGFSQAEMEGMSDIFSYWEREWGMTQENNNTCMPHAFVTCDQVGKDSIFFVPEDNSQKNILNDKEHRIRYGKLLAERNNHEVEVKSAITDFRKQFDR